MIDGATRPAEEPRALDARGRGVHLRARGRDRGRVRQGHCTCSRRATASTTTRSSPHQVRAARRRARAHPRRRLRAGLGGRDDAAAHRADHRRVLRAAGRGRSPTATSSSTPTATCAGPTASSTSASTSSPRACSPSASSKGDHLGIWARNVPDWLTFMFATAKIGVVLVTVNPVYKSHELAYVIKQSDMKALAIIDAFRDVDYVADRARARARVADPGARAVSTRRSSPSSSPHLHGPREAPRLLHRARAARFSASTATTRRTLRRAAGPRHATTSSTCSTPRGRPASPRASCSRTATSSTTASTSASARSSRPPTASACRCRCFHCFGCVLGVLAALTHGATLVMRRAASTRCSCSRPCRRSAPPRSTACRRCSSPSSRTRCSTCST